MKFRSLLTAAALLFLAWAAPALARDETPFFNADALDIRTVIGAPPAPDSAETAEELAALHTLQDRRSPLDEARVRADAKERVWRFNDVLGDSFTRKALPLTNHLFKRVVATVRAVTEPAKTYWDRQRPFAVDSSLKPVVKEPASGSWPSRHAATGALFALILADMVPEKREALLVRGREFANNRMLAGVHYPSDIAAGEKTAAAIYDKLKRSPDFLEAFGAAQQELRMQLGLRG